MTVEELVLLIDLLDKLGYNTETAGTGTVFQRLAQLADYVDTLETKVGLNTDGAGTSTLFARLAQIAGHTDTLESNLGTTGDAANASGTVLARLAELLGNRLTSARAAALDRLINDLTAARAAKLDYLDGYISAVLNRLGGGAPNFFYNKSTNSTAYTTVCNITGSGILNGVRQTYADGGVSHYIKITIDGVVKYDGLWSEVGLAGAAVGGGHGFDGPIRFNSSLVIEHKPSGNYPVGIVATVMTGV